MHVTIKIGPPRRRPRWACAASGSGDVLMCPGIATDWFKGKNHRFSMIFPLNMGFPVNFPLKHYDFVLQPVSLKWTAEERHWCKWNGFIPTPSRQDSKLFMTHIHVECNFTANCIEKSLTCLGILVSGG